jgi:hypothetical protein
MPIKRRVSKTKIFYTETVERLIACSPIERSDAAQSDLVAIAYFSEWPELPDQLRQRAMSILDGWRGEETNRCL